MRLDAIGLADDWIGPMRSDEIIENTAQGAHSSGDYFWKTYRICFCSIHLLHSSDYG